MTAIELAIAADCQLVVVCSMRTRPEKVRSLFARKDFTRGIAVEVPRGYGHRFLRLETTEWMKHGPGKDVCGGRDSDLSTKRNIGLLLAWLLGWQHILFMDDDIRGISVDDLARTVSLLRHGFRSAGMQVKHFPDNSVVCHARRMVGLDQGVFVSGSLLAVDCSAPFGFFPDIYNEDWLFFYRDVAARKLASPGLHATQMRQMKYNPFADPQRAAREEFGDAIAEGLYSPLHHGGPGPELPGSQYWERFLLDRNAILDGVFRQLDKAPAELRDEIKKAMLIARETLQKITPVMCADYIAAWQRDLDEWASSLASLPRDLTMAKALHKLDLS
jgi:hypothetical protein